MKLVVSEHVSSVVQPIVKTFTITAEAVDSINKISLLAGFEKGDILVYKGLGQIERLPVGSDGQVLTADSSSPLGVKWVTPS